MSKVVNGQDKIRVIQYAHVKCCRYFFFICLSVLFFVWKVLLINFNADDGHNFIYELHLLCSDVSVFVKGWPLASFVLQELLGPMGLMSANPLERQAAVSSLSTLMSMTPRDTYIEFEKVLLLKSTIFYGLLVKWGQWYVKDLVLYWQLTRT